MTKSNWPRIRPVGDAAVIVEFGDRIDPEINRLVHGLAARLRQEPPAGLGEAVPTYCTLLVHYDPFVLGYEQAAGWIQTRLAGLSDLPAPAPRRVEIPTVYGGEYGPDLAFVAAHAGLPEAEVIRIHSSRDYLVYMMGFTPGFPYLGGMDEAIAVPRLEKPRTLVPAGSVGIGGKQTGVYSVDSPGGWRLIGYTPLKLFDPGAEPPARLAAGDLVRFVPVSPRSLRMPISVLDPGFLTTVQDLGRWGYERFGVPVSGAMDPFALRAGNALVGNPWGAAALECTLLGPTLNFAEDALVALTGTGFELYLGEQRLPAWTAALVRAGSTVRLVNAAGSGWGYLAVAGGIDVPAVMGSRSTYLRGRFGGLEGRALQAGDSLPVGRSDRRPGSLAGRELPARLRPAYSSAPVVEVILGPQEAAFTGAGMEAFLDGEYTVSSESDRMGYRLVGPQIAHRSGADILSDGIVFGSVQVPASGQPIVLMSDRQTTGGYTKIATVVSADLPLLAQCPAESGRVRFRATTPAAAQERYRAQLRALQTGIVDPDDELALWAAG